MPKKLNISSNERVDLDDFSRASSSYTQESNNFDRQQLTQARRSLVAAGFRIEVSDQSSAPGEFTIYNGTALDRSGNILNNEQQLTDARTLTLSGANSSFYVEIEFVESESDIDARAFWDPTFSANTPPGKEFSLNVATRITPDWQVVSPVSASSFDTDVNTVKVPIAVLQTNASNEISSFTAVNIATVLEEDITQAEVSGGIKKLRVLNSTMFPTTGTATLGLGTGAAEAVSIVANDFANGIITVLVNLVNPHDAGAILVETGTAAAFVVESTSPAPTTGADRRRMLFNGDEIRGSALVASKESAADRDDLDIKSLKDYVDFLSAQIRELKFGSLRSDVNGGIPPSSFTSTRYFDTAGSVLGARPFAITIGDGSLSFGDINSTSSDLATQIQVAHDALNVTNGGTIFVKAGTYVWDTTIGFDRPVHLLFEEGVVLSAGGTGLIEAANLQPIKIENLPQSADDWAPDVRPATTTSSNTVGMNLDLRDSYFGNLDLTGFVVVADAVSVKAQNCTFTKRGTGLTGAVNQSTAVTVSGLEFVACTFLYTNTSSNATTALIQTSRLNNTVFRNCTFDAAPAAFSCGTFVLLDNGSTAVDLEGVEFLGCNFLSTGTGALEEPLRISGVGVHNVIVRDCIFDFDFDSLPTFKEVVRIVSLGDMRDVLVDNCDFSGLTIPTSTPGSPGRILNIEQAGAGEAYDVVVRNCKFGVPISGNTVPSDFVRQIHLETLGGDGVVVDGNSFSTFFTAGVYIASGSATIVNNSFSNSWTSLTTDSVTCVNTPSLGGAIIEHIVISNNKIYFRVNNNANTLAMFIELFEGSCITTDNEIDIINTQTTASSNTKAIFFLPLTTTGNVQRYVVTGNSIYTEGRNISGIELTAVNEVDLHAVFSNNAIDLRCVHGSGKARGIIIESDHASALSPDANHTINGNVITENATVDEAELEGIYFSGTNAVISGNSIRQQDSEACIGIWYQGKYVNVTGNTLEQLTASTTNDLSIGISSVFTVGGHSNDYCSISNNVIFGGLETAWGIRVSQGNGSGLLQGLNISGNTIETVSSSTSTNGFIYVRCLDVSTYDSKGIIINNNSCVEQSFIGAGYVARVGIFMDGFSGKTEGVVISGNSIMGISASLDRNAGAAGIKVQDCVSANIVGNTIVEWSDGTYEGHAIYCRNVDLCGVYSNVCSPQPGGATLKVWDISTGNDLHFHGNMSMGADTINVTAVTNPATITDNKTS